jgi:hypothetical protein
MVGEIAATSSLMFYFKSTALLDFLSYTLLVRYPQKKSQALKSGDLAGHSIFLLREITRAENISLRIRSITRCPVLLKPESLAFSTKPLQLPFQKCGSISV